jgi:glycosyltransferase involved in cell wall biosynthesis
VKLAVVVQRYGHAVNGGAELHARYIAEHLARHAEVEVLTTCATDYVTWRNVLAAGVETVNGVPVRRFHVKHERDPICSLAAPTGCSTTGTRSRTSWTGSTPEGPNSPGLIDYLSTNGGTYDYCLFFSYRYWVSYHGARAVSPRAILVPTAERDATIGLSMFQPVFRGVRALMYNSHEERAMIEASRAIRTCPASLSASGPTCPRIRSRPVFVKYNVPGPFAIYVGRIDQNKGCTELFEFFQALRDAPAVCRSC